MVGGAEQAEPVPHRVWVPLLSTQRTQLPSTGAGGRSWTAGALPYPHPPSCCPTLARDKSLSLLSGQASPVPSYWQSLQLSIGFLVESVWRYQPGLAQLSRAAGRPLEVPGASQAPACAGSRLCSGHPFWLGCRGAFREPVLGWETSCPQCGSLTTYRLLESLTSLTRVPGPERAQCSLTVFLLSQRLAGGGASCLAHEGTGGLGHIVELPGHWWCGSQWLFPTEWPLGVEVAATGHRGPGDLR